MPAPIRAEYDLGRDRFGRTTKLIVELVAHTAVYSIQTERYNQQDQDQSVSDLTADQIARAGAIAASAGGKS